MKSIWCSSIFTLFAIALSNTVMAGISQACRDNPASCSVDETRQLANEALEETCDEVYGFKKGTGAYKKCLKMLGYEQ